MPNSEADRIARQRALRQKRQDEEARDADTQQGIARLRSYVEDIEREIPVVLRLLAERGYPGVVEARFAYNNHPNPIWRLLGMPSNGVKGGWKIGEKDNGEYGIHDIFLLSNGLISIPPAGGQYVAWSMRDRVNLTLSVAKGRSRYSLATEISRYDEFMPQLVLNGLRKLRSELEAR